MHGLVTGQDPRNRQGDLELKLENPTGLFRKRASGTSTKVSSRRWAVNGTDLRSCPPYGIGLLFWIPFNSSAAVSPYMTILGSIRILVFALPISLFAYILRRIPLVVALREPLAVAAALHAVMASA